MVQFRTKRRSNNQFRRLKVSAAACALSALCTVPPSPAQAPPAIDPLPLTDVVLFTSGVGYFQRTGTLGGAADVPISFQTGQVQDVLKSLILIDPDGKVEPVTYSSREPLEKALQAFGINLGGNPTMVDLLAQLRGVKVQITTKAPNPETVTGVIISAEQNAAPPPPVDGPPRAPVSQGSVNLLTDTGIRSIALQQVDSLQILDPAVAAQVKDALGLIGSQHDSQHRTVVLHFGAGAPRKVQAGYVTEAPVWKTSYRLALDENNKAYLQGWAVVDNSTDQDWQGIQLTLVSGHPISFLQDLYTPLYVPRPVVPPDVQANPYPQLSEENLMENAAKSVAQAAAPANSPSTAYDAGGGGFGVRSRIVNGVDQDGALLDKPSHVPGSFRGAAGTMQVTFAWPVSGEKVGDLFQYRIRTPVTIARQQSAMIPIVTENVKAEKLDLYNSDVFSNHPENAVELTNSTGLHIKAGPATLFGGGSYGGDARMPELEPNETELITYAVDSSMGAAREENNTESHLTAIRIQHGVLNLENRSRLTTKYRFKSKLDAARTVMIEQPVQAGWTLAQPAKADEKTATFYRFRLPVAAHASVPFTVAQEIVQSQGIGLVDADINTILQYRSNEVASPAVRQALADIAQRKGHVIDLSHQLEAQKGRLTTISAEQDRIRQNMGQLDRNSDLYKRYIKELDQQEDEIGRVKAEIERLQGELNAAQADLTKTIDGLNLE